MHLSLFLPELVLILMVVVLFFASLGNIKGGSLQGITLVFAAMATLAAVAVFGVEMAQDSDDVSGELLDMGCTILGGAIGSYVTDRFILAPYIHQGPDGHSTRGVATYKF